MENIRECLRYIPVRELSYEEWIRVGMALREEGLPFSVWDEWSRDDERYHPGECEKKWNSFSHFNGKKVTGASIVQMARERGMKDLGLSWEDEIGVSDAPGESLARYLEALFLPDETISYNVDAKQDESGSWHPFGRGIYTRKAGELIRLARENPGDPSRVVGDWNPEAGGWIRINPVDGKGIGNQNVTAFRNVLVECDSLPPEEQKARLKALHLPIRALVSSGGRSIHAIVAIDAKSEEEYQKKVSRLYTDLQEKGFPLDIQNRNPSRLSRMPGLTRGGKKQELLWAAPRYEARKEPPETEKKEDDPFPPFISVADGYRNPPEPPEELIEGVLRKGHKMLISGSSKASKSFLLMELCIALAEGKPWLGFPCRQGKVLYINLEIDPASCMLRFMKIYAALGIQPCHAEDIQIWNLRGLALPLDQLVPRLIPRIRGENFCAVILDPIYKVITGDENSASDMGYFCNQFDRICRETGCAAIYCHHHSKGAQGDKKAMDRASGSGVFARDPDAQLDMIELALEGPLKDEAQHRGITAWRMEGSLREFPTFTPVQFWFDYPVHRLDLRDELSASPASGSKQAYFMENRKNTTAEQRKKAVQTAWLMVSFREKEVTLQQMADEMGVSVRCARDRIKEMPDEYIIRNSVVCPVNNDRKEEAGHESL